MGRHFLKRKIFHSNQRVILHRHLEFEIFLEIIINLIFGLLVYLNLTENAIEFSGISGNTNR